MTRLNKRYDAARWLVDLRLDGIHPVGKLRAGEDKCELGDIHIVKAQAVRRRGNVCGKLCEDTLDLALLLALEQTELVVCVNDRERLDKHCRARRRYIVNKSADFVFVLRFDGDNESSTSLSDYILLQKSRV